MASTKNRFAIGTANFGLKYGVANRVGQLTVERVREVLSRAESAGISMLDTAVVYGNSEDTLGHFGLSSWDVVTKIPAVPDDCNDVSGWVQKQVDVSLRKLGIGRLYALLLHRPEQLLGSIGSALYRALNEQKVRGVASKIGISIYSPEELDKLFGAMMFDLVQVPFNVLDRRLIASGWLSRLYAQNVEVHARSVFLQGLLLTEPNKRPRMFSRWQLLWDIYERWLADTELTSLQACLRYVESYPEIARIVVGVDGAEQLSGILAAADGVLPPVPESLGTEDADLLNPSRWNLQ